jgi:hypothetical protein
MALGVELIRCWTRSWIEDRVGFAFQHQVLLNRWSISVPLKVREQGN